ncbi:MAG: cell wall hydrolase [Desulfotomaculum sp.]|nr:cell wall hydrolase [Desulfotomaculum sp.]
MKKLKKFTAAVLLAVLTCSPAAPAAAGIHTIQPGDSLYSISLKYGTTLHQLMELNQLNSSSITPGQKIKVPGNGKLIKPLKYILMPGEKLYQITLQFNPAAQAAIAANGLSEAVIYPSQVLKVSPRTEPASRSSRRPVIPYTKEDLDLLSRLIAAESRGEPQIGQIGVGAVVINRVQSPLFPNSIKDVIYQPSQFGPVRTGLINRPAPDYCVQAAKKALYGADPTNGALFFFDTSTSSRFLRSLPVAAKHGNLIFAYPK